MLFAALGALQVVAGVVSIFVAPAGTPALLGSGGIFGLLSNWSWKLSAAANTRLERIASDEKARELIDSISDPAKRDEEIARFIKALIARSK